jgi:hypothetical protein
VELLMFALLSLLACGSLGLTPDVNLVSARSEDTAASPRGHGNDDDAAGSSDSDAEPVESSLIGNTWALNLADVTFTEPPGMGSALGLMRSTTLLFHARDEGKQRLDLMVTLAAEDGRQDPCQSVQTLPSANWTNPVFALDQGDINLRISGENVAFADAVLTATVSPDGQGWYDGSLAATLDGREFAAALPEGTDVCMLVDAMGGACIDCADGVKQCFDVFFEDIKAEPAVGVFDTAPDGC